MVEIAQAKNRRSQLGGRKGPWFDPGFRKLFPLFVKVFGSLPKEVEQVSLLF